MEDYIKLCNKVLEIYIYIYTWHINVQNSYFTVTVQERWCGCFSIYSPTLPFWVKETAPTRLLDHSPNICTILASQSRFPTHRQDPNYSRHYFLPQWAGNWSQKSQRPDLSQAFLPIWDTMVWSTRVYTYLHLFTFMSQCKVTSRSQAFS